MGISYLAVDYKQKVILHAYDCYTDGSPGIFIVGNPFCNIVCWKNTFHSYDFVIKADVVTTFEEEYEDKTYDFHVEYFEFIGVDCPILTIDEVKEFKKQQENR